LYKQSYSDNRVALEIEQAAIFWSPRLNSRPYAHFHIQTFVSFGQHDSRSD
jgi:hypothetical protein